MLHKSSFPDSKNKGWDQSHGLDLLDNLGLDNFFTETETKNLIFTLKAAGESDNVASKRQSEKIGCVERQSQSNLSDGNSNSVFEVLGRKVRYDIGVL